MFARAWFKLTHRDRQLIERFHQPNVEYALLGIYASMHVILGANGHIGSVVAKDLLERGEPVTVVLHSDAKAADWAQKGAVVAVAEVHDSAALSRVFHIPTGSRALLPRD